MNRTTILLLFVAGFSTLTLVAADDPAISEATEACLMCHEAIHPGIVSGWRASRHAKITPGEAMAVEGLARKVSSEQVPQEQSGVVVGCAECHTLRPGEQMRTFHTTEPSDLFGNTDDLVTPVR